jgi:hypothetical protein
MAEYTNAAPQTVALGQNVQFTETPVCCTRGYVQHREGSGIFTLRGITNQCRALYKVSFGGNIAIPTGGTVGEISIAIAIEGEPLASATAIVTPAAVENFFNVFTAVFVSVPRGCCLTVAVENTSDQPITVQNANLIIERVA